MSIYLLSGGGNDIIGKEMRAFLKAKEDWGDISEGSKRYLNKQFDEKIKELIGYVKEICEQANAKVPDIHILMHVYDYIIPRENIGWVGKHMIEAGIKSQTEWQALVNYMIDYYHNALVELANGIEYLTIVDTKNAVRDYQWSDEIHPTSLGFMKVAERFERVIA